MRQMRCLAAVGVATAAQALVEVGVDVLGMEGATQRATT